MADIQEFIQKRGRIKSSLTRFSAFIDNLTDDSTEITQLRLRTEKAKNLLAQFEEIQDKLEDADNTQSDQREEFENAYFETLAKAENMLRDIQLTETSSTVINKEDTLSNIKLPAIKLHTFNGDYTQWLTFRDLFVSVIHENKSLSDVQKFQYLRGSLLGEPLKCISSLETTSQNYITAWKLLEYRYENKKLIIHNHVKELLELPAIVKTNHWQLRQFIDTITTHLRALESLKEPVGYWDTLLIHIFSGKLDSITNKEWQEFSAKQDANTMINFMDFLNERCQILEVMAKTDKFPKGKETYSKPYQTSHVNTTEICCTYCKKGHKLTDCDGFKKLNIKERREHVTHSKLCYNCLRANHTASKCQSSACKKCNRNHHTLIHVDLQSKPREITENQVKAEEIAQASCNHTTHSIQSSVVILSTAIVLVNDINGQQLMLRVLLDGGAQSNFITREACNKLGLKLQDTDMNILGILGTSENQAHISQQVQATIHSRTTTFKTTLTFLVVPQITQNIPLVSLSNFNMDIPTYLPLADPEFMISSKVDMLIGAEIYLRLLCIGQIRLAANQPVLQKTVLGWIVSGKTTMEPKKSSVSCLSINILERQIEKFWESEEIIDKKYYTEEELKCENHFAETHSRNIDGRFVVRLPKKEGVLKLGNSYEGALRRYQALENKLNRDENLKAKYTEFMDEFIALNHMERIKSEFKETEEEVYYLPHHPVLKSESLTTKLRVVFDGSFKTNTGSSLNDILLAGPVIQDELFDIILRFRCHQVVLTADIKMMFRQIYVHPDDRNLQRVLWRTNKDEEIQKWTLNTVTYGTTTAPFLATRCLKQLALEDGKDFPQAKMALEKDFYMDDILTGAPSLDEAKELQKQLTELLEKGKFTLRKWRSNSAEVLSEIQQSDQENALMVLNKNETLKTLGVLWNSESDSILYRVIIDSNYCITKRNILSRIAQIFDPLGLLGPIIITAKIFMQTLWQLKLGWDELLPEPISNKWATYYHSLNEINEWQLRRNINPNNSICKFDIHGFCDSSEAAYGACLYAVSQDANGNINSELICAKSRVSPLKTQSLPRLELNGAVLLSRLVSAVERALTGKVKTVYLWTDSTIVLAWIKASPSQLKTYVANRVAEVQTLTSDKTWGHVMSSENPADILSRGTSVETLYENTLWWNGPKWLKSDGFLSIHDQVFNTDLEYKAVAHSLLARDNPKLNGLMDRYSSFTKLIRIFAYCNRFIYNIKNKDIKKKGVLTTQEQEDSTQAIVRLVQAECFADEIKDLLTVKYVKKTSKIFRLQPFLDNNGLIRVGGRLKHANISIDYKHPCILPADHHVVTILIQEQHIKLHHCGQEQLLSHIRQTYWPISGRKVVKRVIHKCVTCWKVNPKCENQVMGDLPAVRVQGYTRPFASSGIDYAGPIKIRESKRRGKIHISKGYIAIFVCMVTKAVHIELVSDLTTDAFLAAMRRFMARRGLCTKFYSDNGSNFVGAERHLREMYDFLMKNNSSLETELSKLKVEWSFIPPRSPHFGGLWEATVKSTKRHLHKITKDIIFTFEEYSTLLTEIESILNSRPLTILSPNPNDPLPLTPAHFLVGDTLLEPAETNYVSLPDTRLSRWQQIQKIRQHFWDRWHKEYLHTLQTRNRWSSAAKNMKIGDLVLVMEENLPPMKWILGRVIEVHPGVDNVVRVVTIRTPTGTCKRAIRKLCLLPISDNFE